MIGVLIMNITLGKKFERKITGKVSDGLYTSESEVIRYGLRMFGALFSKQLVFLLSQRVLVKQLQD
jgi:putative addiction module CopG family antidote